MNTNKQAEIKLLEMYDQELVDFLDSGLARAGRQDKESSKQFLQETQRKIEIYEKQILNCKTLFPANNEFKNHESRLYLFQGILNVIYGLYYEKFPSMFSPSKFKKISEAIYLFEKSLETNESSKTRNMLVFCHRQLGNDKKALDEIDNILQRHADDEDVYLSARIEKDELESKTSSGIGSFFRPNRKS